MSSPAQAVPLRRLTAGLGESSRVLVGEPPLQDRLRPGGHSAPGHWLALTKVPVGAHGSAGFGGWQYLFHVAVTPLPPPPGRTIPAAHFLEAPVPEALPTALHVSPPATPPTSPLAQTEEAAARGESVYWEMVVVIAGYQLPLRFTLSITVHSHRLVNT